VEAFNDGVQVGAFLQNGLGVFRVVPETFPGQDVFDLFKPFLFGRDVKDTPLAVPVSTDGS